MRPDISARARVMPASPIRKLTPFADEAKRRGIHVHHLNIGQPYLETPAALRDQLKHLETKVFAYTPSGGTEEFLSVMQDYYRGLGLPLELDDIIATTGGSEALFFSFLACAGQGDDILVFDPTRVTDGIDLSDDPILRFRPRAYAASVTRRSGVPAPALRDGRLAPGERRH